MKETEIFTRIILEVLSWNTGWKAANPGKSPCPDFNFLIEKWQQLYNIRPNPDFYLCSDRKENTGIIPKKRDVIVVTSKCEQTYEVRRDIKNNITDYDVVFVVDDTCEKVTFEIIK